jgi:formate hydrogenlyase subunit 3/multisubunit Na+/H+ antiporter MnhD subunit
VVSTRYLAASAAVTAIVVVTVWLTNLSFQRAILLAPVLVVGIGAVAGLIVFWGRVGWESYRRSRHRRAIAVASVVVLAILVVLSILGVKLPHE